MTPRTYIISTPEQAKHLNFTTRSIISAALNDHWKVEYSESLPDNSASGLAVCTKNDREVAFLSDQTALTPIYAFSASENKNLTAALFQKAGIPTPESITIPVNSDEKTLSKYLKTFSLIVVKPLDTNHGDGITIDIDNLQKLQRAIRYAHSAKPSNQFVLLQKQICNAKEYRFLVLENKVIAVAHRRPPFVTGDGTSTIRKLIDQVNSDPLRGTGHQSVLTKIDPNDVIAANDADFLSQIPSPGQEVEVLKTSNLSRGGISEDFTDRASEKLKKIAIQAARSCHLGLAGIDIMTPDITNGDAKNSFVIEANNAPGLRMHEFPSIGTPRNVSQKIWRTLKKYSRPIAKHITKIGRVEPLKFPDFNNQKILSKVDTGATYSAIWASARETSAGLEVSFLNGKYSKTFTNFSRRAVQNSTGDIQVRYVVKLPVSLKGRKILAQFTLADRSKQAYPILIGRNILRNKFIIDVAGGKANRKLEKSHRDIIKKGIKK